uniref:hypothetical protein n=1 Tax=Vibrio cholerae TaxID=666 RepID=UPI00301C0BDA
YFSKFNIGLPPTRKEKGEDRHANKKKKHFFYTYQKYMGGQYLMMMYSDEYNTDKCYPMFVY